MENEVSIRTKNLNILNQKIKPFRRQFSQSLSRINQKSSMHTLAKTTYSIKNNLQFTQQKMRPPSAGNPQMRMSSPALKGLNMRASHIPNLSDINTELLLDKRKLQEKINFLKEEIARETRMKNRNETNWKLHSNGNSYANQSFEELCKKSVKINENIGDLRNQNCQLNREINQLRHANSQKRTNINQEQQNVRRMTIMVNSLKANMLQEEKQRNSVKAELMKQQRVMDSCSIQAKEFQNERAMLLLDINNSVVKNKL